MNDLITLKVGELFDLPVNVLRIEGRRGRIKDDKEIKILALFEVVKIKDESGQDIYKGKVICTYGNRRNDESLDNGRQWTARKEFKRNNTRRLGGKGNVLK